MRQHLGVALLAGVSALALGTAHAQTRSAAPAAAAATTVNEVVVTGSRVNTGANSPTPVTVMDVEQYMKLQPTSVTEAINLLPALQGSQNITSRPGGGQRNGAGAYMNLRNMGNLRTLVLMDGQRVVPTINQNEADTDATVVPQLLLKRADVVTGGVSAVYGSDAISGVINFITDRNFNGFKFQANDGISTFGDDKIWDVGFAAGRNFAGDRGHVEVSYQHHDDPGLQTQGEAAGRPNVDQQLGGVGAGTAANPYFNIPQIRTSNSTYGGLIIGTSVATDAALRGLQFTPTGTLTAFNHGLIPIAGGTLAPFGTAGTLASASVESGGDGTNAPNTSYKHGIRYDQVFGRLDYELTDNIHAYVQGSYVKIHSFNQFNVPSFVSGTGGLTISYANPFLASVQEPYRTTFLTNPTRTFAMNETFLNQPANTQNTKSYMIFAGLDGKLGEKFSWEVTYGKQQSIIQANDLFNFQRGRLFAALDAVDVGQVTTGVRNGQTACRATTAYTGHAANPYYAGCVPINFFGGKPSQASLDYLYEPTFNRNQTDLNSFSGSITGTPFKTWAGPVKVALSGEYRDLQWVATSNTDPSALANCAGIQFNCTATTAYWQNNTMGPVPKVTQKVKEIAVEAEVPLLADLPFAQAFSVTGAARHTDYSTSGKVTTWKVGGDWRINDDIRLRATRSRDIRAPNVFDLFTSLQVNCSFNIQDPLTGATFNNICNTQGSNPNLKPEFANTLTAGGVFTPSFLPGLSLTVDYYKIKVDDVILLQQGWNAGVVSFCFNLKGAAPICDLISRKNWTDTNAATNPITSVRSQNVNVAKLETWGIDYEATYRSQIFDRPASLQLLASYQPKFDYDQGPSGILSIAGAYNTGSNRLAASPIWKVTGVASFQPLDNFTVTVLERWRDKLDATYLDNVVLVDPKLPSYATTTLNLSYKMNDTPIGDAEVFLNVANLFNKFPTVYYPGGRGPGQPEGDDTIGRYYTVGVRSSF